MLGCQYIKSAIFLFLRKKIVFTRDYVYVPRLTYRSKRDLLILLRTKDLVGVIFLILEQFLNKILGIFPSFSHCLSMHVLNMLILHFVRKVFLGKLCFKA